MQDLVDGGASVLRTFGERRLKMVLALSRMPELDDPQWSGKVQFDVGLGQSIKESVHPAAREIKP